MDARIRLIAADVDRLRIIRASEFAHHVLRQVDQHRPRTPRPGDIECLLDDPPQILSVSHSHPVFCNASGNAHDIHFLERVVPDQVLRHLPGKAYKRDAVIIRRGKPCDQVGRSRAACDKADPHLPRGPRIRVRFMDQRLLMARQDDADIILLIQLIADINGARPRVAEDRVHSFLFQSPYQ